MTRSLGLAGRNALVTGAAGGIGAAVVQLLRAEGVRAIFVENIRDARLVKQIAEEAGAQGIRTWHLSLSHDGGIATAVVVAES